LESFYVGGRRKATRQAIERFLSACRKQQWAGMHDPDALERAMAAVDRVHGHVSEANRHAGKADAAASTGRYQGASQESIADLKDQAK
jgi:hypothetical protein